MNVKSSIRADPAAPASKSYAHLLANLGVLVLALALIAIYRFRPNLEHMLTAFSKDASLPVISESNPKDKAVVVAPEAKVEPDETEDDPPPAIPKPKTLDRAAVASANEALMAARRDRQRSEDRLKQATLQVEDSAAASATWRWLRARSRARSATTASASPEPPREAAQVKVEIGKLQKDLESLGQAPKSKTKPLLSKTPVAKPSHAEEFHFEVRRNRVAFVNLERLLELAQNDMRDKFRQAPSDPEIVAQVGPVGSFSLKYVFARSPLETLDDAFSSRRIPYHLQGWEIVPTFDIRGEDYRTTRGEISDYALALRKLSPGKSTITMWVYPDSFELYRKLRDDLHDQGYTVAARPLPDGVPIRASSSGSLSAGQ